MTFIDYNHPMRRNYALLDKDKLDVLGDIATNIECLNDTLNYFVEPKLERVAAALEKLAGIAPAADTPTDSDEPADASALTEHPAADTDTLKAANEKLDAALDTLNLIAGATNPDAAFSLRRFSDGSGRFLPTDKATPTETPTTDD